MGQHDLRETEGERLRVPTVLQPYRGEWSKGHFPLPNSSPEDPSIVGAEDGEGRRLGCVGTAAPGSGGASRPGTSPHRGAALNELLGNTFRRR